MPALAQLMLDHRLGVVAGQRRIAWSKAACSLPRSIDAAQPVDLDPVTAARVGLDYERWADARRGELNLVIARQTADWLEARSDAQTAFGRVQALHELADKA